MVSTTGGHIVVHNVNDGQTGYDGYTTWNCSGSYYASTNTTVNMSIAGSYSVSKRQAVWVHEVGHSIGLNHSQYSSAIMNSCSTCAGTNIPVADDANGVNALY